MRGADEVNGWMASAQDLHPLHRQGLVIYNESAKRFSSHGAPTACAGLP